jgi:hypothetical protein
MPRLLGTCDPWRQAPADRPGTPEVLRST